MTKHHKKPHPDHHSDAAVEHVPHRTTLQTIAVIFVFLHGAFYTAVAYSFIQQAGGRENSSLYLSILLLSSLADIVAGFGIWRWKRWGLILYFISTVVMAGATLLLTGDMLLLFGSILPMIIVAYILLPQMKEFE